MLTVILSLYPKVFNAQQKYLGWRPSPRCQSGTRSPEQMWQNVKCEKCKVGRAPETAAQTLATLPLLPLSPTITFGNWTRGRPIFPSIGKNFFLNFGQKLAFSHLICGPPWGHRSFTGDNISGNLFCLQSRLWAEQRAWQEAMKVMIPECSTLSGCGLGRDTLSSWPGGELIGLR